MADYTEKLTDSQAMGFIDQVGGVFKSLPHLPSGVVEFLVKVAPYLALISAVLGLIGGPVVALLGALGTLLTLSPIVLLGTVGTAVILIAQSILLLMAFGPLKARQTRGWVLMFWSDMLAIPNLILTVLGGNTSNIIGSVVGLLIGLYILFEMRSSYSGAAAAKEAVKEEVKKVE